jgi:exo-beta-1,3-glucanase (GH17 family)
LIAIMFSKPHNSSCWLNNQCSGVLAAFVLLSICPAAHSAEPRPLADNKAAIQQKPGDLLCGQLRGICYSGFRTGQHPDRGNGAINPTEKEILEDLKILGRHGDFPLIRLYDSMTNSEVVLQLIQQHKLNFKVLLGAWLSAEVNNPGCSWLKPMPDEVLRTNQHGNLAEVQNLIRLANQYSNIVCAVAVGNEALVSWNDHMVPEESVIQYVRQVKQAVSQPVTVCDN